MTDASSRLSLLVATSLCSTTLFATSTSGAQVGATTAEAAAAAAAEAKNHVSNYIDLNGSLGIATNPRLASGGKTGVTGLGRISAYAAHSVVSNRNSLTLSAYVENQSYTNGTKSTQSFDLEGSLSHVVNPRVSVFARAGFSGDVGGQLHNRFYSLPSAPPVVEVGNPLQPSGPLDPNFISLNRRQFRLSGSGGFSDRISPRDSINASLGYDRIFFSGAGGGRLGYDTVSGTFGWDRIVSERTTAGLRLLASRTTYSANGHSTVFSPQLTASTRLTEGWTASGSIGVSIVDQKTTTARGRSVSPSFDASICRSTEVETICGHAARSAQASIGQSLVNSTSVGATYFRRLGSTDTIQFGAGVSRSSGDNSILGGRSTTLYDATGSYNRKLSPRLFAGAEAGVRKVSGGNSSIPVAASATIFLRYRLGDLL